MKKAEYHTSDQNLHSNMDDYRPGISGFIIVQQHHLHSNMDDYRLYERNRECGYAELFTFQYGRL